MSTPLASIPEISFVETDSAKVEAEIIRLYELMVGYSIKPADPERLVVEALSYIGSKFNVEIDDTGKQNLLRYARTAKLDHIGALHGSRGLRLDSTKASAEASFSIEEALGSDLIIPTGTGLDTTFDDDWEVVDSVTIIAGELTASGSIQCQAAGALGNGYAAGQIEADIEVEGTTVTVANTAMTLGGSDPEDDEHYRERLWLAPCSLSTCGSRHAYSYWLKSSSPEVIDADVLRTQPNVMHCWLLMADGRLPTEDELADAAAYIDSDELMPEGDEALVLAPAEISQNLTLTWYAHEGYAPLVARLADAVSAAVDGYKTWQTTKLGRDFLPDALVTVLGALQGFKRAEVTSPVFQALERGQVARIPTIEITFGGFEDE